MSVVSEAVVLWAREAGLVTDVRQEMRLRAMRLEVLACGALPEAGQAEVVLTAQWAAFVCWVDDRIDREGLESSPGELERYIASLRQGLAPGLVPPATLTSHAAVLRRLWERTAAGTGSRWQERLRADYLDFLDATEQEVFVRRTGARLALPQYLRLRRRTITLLPMLDIVERTGRASLVEAPLVDGQLRQLRWALADIAGWANDLASETDELARGQESLVAVVAREYGCSTVRARERVAVMIEQRRASFHTIAADLRTTSDLPPDRLEAVNRYVDLVERFMAATLHWLLRTGRFTSGPAPPPAPP
ncbi:terpene synthase family protein [Streptomyces sp. NPDC040750]|uniref:terpene synthase family protein n=1 Tax=Streptomyces sp. NPDC040750 TaxID=3154491 RepID=UPI0033C5749A